MSEKSKGNNMVNFWDYEVRVTVFTFFILFQIVVSLTGCNIINPPETIPAYIHIDSIHLETDSAKEGTTSDKIVDAWVYLNDSYIGTYELPATIPLLSQGKQQIKIGAGIMENGISTTRIFYYPYAAYSSNVELSLKKTDTIVPIIQYHDNLTFAFMEDFETIGGIKFITISSDTTVSVRKISDPIVVFEGIACGGILLKDNTTFECRSSDNIKINAGTNVFMEMNYMNNNSFSVGVMQASNANNKTYKVTVNSKSIWNKIYINLTDVVGSMKGQPFNLVFKVSKESASETAIYWDNIKLIY